jgi:hypothetical protein
MKFLAATFLIIMFSFSALAGEKRLKVIECGTDVEVFKLLSEYKEYALVGGLGQVEFQNGKIERLPIYVFVNADKGTFTIAEFFPQAQEACVIAFGNGLDFDVAKYFLDKKESY